MKTNVKVGDYVKVTADGSKMDGHEGIVLEVRPEGVCLKVTSIVFVPWGVKVVVRSDKIERWKKGEAT